MTVLVVGGTGATGRLLLQELLMRCERVRTIVRGADGLPEQLRRHGGRELIRASLLELTDADSPTRSPIFEVGSTSRINVAHCMAELLTGEALWRTWKGRMPVIYNPAQADPPTDPAA
jgi:nucleoside-diphosphate-sugar epimerase